jgi:hypothetical protein
MNLTFKLLSDCSAPLDLTWKYKTYVYSQVLNAYPFPVRLFDDKRHKETYICFNEI